MKMAYSFKASIDFCHDSASLATAKYFLVMSSWAAAAPGPTFPPVTFVNEYNCKI